MAGSMATTPTGPGQQERAEALYELLAERILVLDGATGTWLQGQDLTAEDFGGGEARGLQRKPRPDPAGRGSSGCTGTTWPPARTWSRRTRSAAPPSSSPSTAWRTRPWRSTAGRPRSRASGGRGLHLLEGLRFVAGSMGPTTKAMTVTGGVTFDELVVHYRIQAMGLLQGGADVLLLETTQDTRNLKAGLIGIEQAFAEIGGETPVMVSVTIEPMGTMLAGQGVDALYASVMHAPLLSVGINCATGPEFMPGPHPQPLGDLPKR